MSHPLTSHDSPLRIATLQLATGRLGMTICPGKQAPTSVGGHPWSRDLDVDLVRIEDWGADAVVTLMEAWELEKYGVRELGRAVTERSMKWLHLPIVDGDAPSRSWDQEWSSKYSADIHRLLNEHGSVLIHCLGGRGRTGTVAARLLMERGLDLDRAILKVRAARQGAVETAAQESYLSALGQRLLAEGVSMNSDIKVDVHSCDGKHLTPEEPEGASAAYVKELILTGALCRVEDILSGLNMTERELATEVREHRMFSIEIDSVTYYPAFYLDPTLNRKQLAAVCQVMLDLHGWSKWHFFTGRKFSLASRTPLQALAQGDLSLVLACAEAYCGR